MIRPWITVFFDFTANAGTGSWLVQDGTIRDSMAQPRQFPCKQCGAMLEFAPGTHALKCVYCGTLNDIPASESGIEELDFAQQLLDLQNSKPTLEAVVIRCEGCGGESTLAEGKASGDCPFCGRAIVATSLTRTLIKPASLLPFAIPASGGREKFDNWLGGLWFAPSKLKQHADKGGLKGVYIPAWTYDCNTLSDYTGQRGEHYWDTESYMTSVNGKSVTQTRQVRKTRWYAAAGQVQNHFDDLLVLADRSLPEDLRSSLAGWDLPQLVPYDDAYLSGFVAETYQVELRDGFEIARQMAQPVIRNTVNGDIGGDEQRIDTLQTQYHDITFKHILLPIWISAYRYNNRTFHFIINGRTGAVFGQRPYSAWKIAIAITIGVILLIIVLLIAASR